ncbi:hypothetical protein HPB50_028203 [Hyalomma asiaticum]|nr:hypothetical protein HPB50_028203 [Hyalomma asiaticum]
MTIYHIYSVDIAAGLGHPNGETEPMQLKFARERPCGPGDAQLRCPEWRPDTKTSCTEGLGQPPNRRAGAFGFGNSRKSGRGGRTSVAGHPRVDPSNADVLCPQGPAVERLPG